MNTHTKMIIGAAVGVAVIGLVALTPAALAYRGDMTKTGPNHTEARETAMEQVMAKNNFAEWKKLMTENGRTPGVLRTVDTQAEFDKFAQAWKLSQTGKAEDLAAANKIRSELGLGNGAGKGTGVRGQNRSGNFVDANKDGVCDRM